MTTIFHKNCGGTLLVNIKSGLEMLCDFSIQKTGLRVERLQVSRNKGKIKIPTVFNCQSCDEIEIDMDNIQILCSYCNNAPKTFVNINYYPLIGSFFCNNCAKKHLKDEEIVGKKKIEAILSNISLIPAKKRMQ